MNVVSCHLWRDKINQSVMKVLTLSSDGLSDCGVKKKKKLDRDLKIKEKEFIYPFFTILFVNYAKFRIILLFWKGV